MDQGCVKKVEEEAPSLSEIEVVDEESLKSNDTNENGSKNNDSEQPTLF